MYTAKVSNIIAGFAIFFIIITALLCIAVPRLYIKTFLFISPIVIVYKIYFKNFWSISKFFLMGKYRSVLKNISILQAYPFNNTVYAKKLEVLMSIELTLKHMKGTDTLYKCLAFQRICSHLLDGKENVLSFLDKTLIILYNLIIFILLFIPLVVGMNKASNSFVNELLYVIHEFRYIYLIACFLIVIFMFLSRRISWPWARSSSKNTSENCSYVPAIQHVQKVDEIVFYIYSTYGLYEYFSFCPGYRDSYIYANKIGSNKPGKVQRFICKDIGLRKELRCLYSTFVPVQVGRNYLLPFDHRDQCVKCKEIKLLGKVRIFLLSYFEYILIAFLFSLCFWLLALVGFQNL